jgi:hypothetical protein
MALVTPDPRYRKDDLGNLLGVHPEEAPDDPRFQRPFSNVGYQFVDAEEPNLVLTVVWDGAYRDPTNWGWTRGLISTSENDLGDSRNVFQVDEHPNLRPRRAAHYPEK